MQKDKPDSANPKNNKRVVRTGKRRVPTSKQRSVRYSRLSARQKDTYQRALALLSDLRRGIATYSELLRKYRLRGRTARKYLGRDLIGGSGGKRVRASKSDRRVREVLFPTSVGDVLIRTRSSRDATKISEYFHDRDLLLRGKLSAAEFEAKWRGVRVAGRELFADTTAILEMADADLLKVAHLYSITGGEQ
jgi:hypothetical protein